MNSSLQEKERNITSLEQVAADVNAQNVRNTQIISSLEESCNELRKELKKKEGTTNKEIQWYRKQKKQFTKELHIYNCQLRILHEYYAHTNKAMPPIVLPAVDTVSNEAPPAQKQPSTVMEQRNENVEEELEASEAKITELKLRVAELEEQKKEALAQCDEIVSEHQKLEE